MDVNVTPGAAASARERSSGSIPLFPAKLLHPAGEIAHALDAELIFGDPARLDADVKQIKVGAMELPHFLDHLEDGSLIITPGDRSDIILASLIADVSTTYPRVAGLLLTGGMRPADNVQKLLEGLRRSKVSILSVPMDTFTTALAVNRVESTILAGDDRKIAAALGLFEHHVDVADLRQRIAVRHSVRRTPLMFEYELIHRAKAHRQRIVLPEGTDERILKAAEILTLRGVAELTLLGDPDKVRRRIGELGLKLGDITVLDPRHDPRRDEFAAVYHGLRKHKGISEQMAHDAMEDVSYFGTMMVHLGQADGMVSGAVHTTQHTIRPSFEIVKTKPGVRLVSSVFFMCLPDQVLVYGDCAVNPNPSADDLADIAITSAGPAQVRFALTLLPGRLRVDTAAVSGARVSVAGQARGVTPLEPFELAAGEHGLTLSQLLGRARIGWHGVRLGEPDWGERSHSLACTLWSLSGRSVFHLMANAFWEPLRFELPVPPAGGQPGWRRLIDTACPAPDDIAEPGDAPLVPDEPYLVQPRSVVFLIARGR